ncbi:TetR/AcrR family transcriptional regulator [Microbacterium invictum]|uniref:AcrR family transcriptional regulator n=1 Tax=Microbacterium invictum TaxID=515415 RepID=A0AA40SNG2_9MICO|nr:MULTISPECIES: TetR/AcrR family transcriptional regulator [Microbacterium]MBB4139447.1 AcrR family transcriptional regulator [Microbacterium invictum]
MSEQRRGAPRSEAARQAILAATAQLFAERGYEQLTIEGIAAEAGVGKQTIYRWWPTKSALVAECLLEGRLLPGQLTLPDTGDLRGDLVGWVEQIFALMDEPTGRGLVTSLVAAATANVEIGARLRDSLGGAESVTTRLTAGVAAGQLPADAPVVELSEALVGAVLLKALSGRAGQPGDAARLVDALVRA